MPFLCTSSRSDLFCSRWNWDFWTRSCKVCQQGTLCCFATTIYKLSRLPKANSNCSTKHPDPLPHQWIVWKDFFKALSFGVMLMGRCFNLKIIFLLCFMPKERNLFELKVANVSLANLFSPAYCCKKKPLVLRWVQCASYVVWCATSDESNAAWCLRGFIRTPVKISDIQLFSGSDDNDHCFEGGSCCHCAGCLYTFLWPLFYLIPPHPTHHNPHPRTGRYMGTTTIGAVEESGTCVHVETCTETTCFLLPVFLYISGCLYLFSTAVCVWSAGLPFRTAIISCHGLQSRVKVPARSAVELSRVGDLQSIKQVAVSWLH